MAKHDDEPRHRREGGGLEEAALVLALLVLIAIAVLALVAPILSALFP